ncbi:hypothetical protein M501DRAFT_1019292 [Patellaria atrata CBS 101060]|uniref:Uncharacterized protein n=1 Tax=Patellaria atrata CBS 101060 TaxID=1346257 RepID=A0A9P4S574_9PEZI|nr:hypothetical protein M501DRAFT_1019292 [Patellaria atrata CBS 101060]
MFSGASVRSRLLTESPFKPLQALFNKLCVSVCFECGDFGGYMYLVSFERLCCRCVLDKDRRLLDKNKYAPLRKLDAVLEYGLTPEALDTLPQFLGYPGYYGSIPWLQKDYVSLIARDSPRDAGIALHGSLQAMQDYTANADLAVLKLYKKKIRKFEKQAQAERAEYARRQKAKQIARTKKRNDYKMKVIRKKIERAERLGVSESEFNEQERNTNPKFPIEDIDNESVSTLGLTSRRSTPETILGNEGHTEGDGDNSESSFTFDQKLKNAGSTSGENSCDEDADSEVSDAELASSECSSHEGNEGSYDREELRYGSMILVPWLNRQSKKDEWGFR